MYSMNRPMKAMILDFDNTLVLTNEFVHSHIVRTCTRLSIPLPTDNTISSVLKENLKFEQIFVRLFGDKGDMVLEMYRSDAKEYKFKAIAGGPKKIQELYESGIKLVIVTNRVNLTLARLKEAGYEEDWFTSVESSPEGHSKPDVLAYENALRILHELGIKDSEIAVVGDAYVDYAAIPENTEGGKILTFIGVTSGSLTLEEWRRVGISESFLVATVAEMTLPNLYNREEKVS